MNGEDLKFLANRAETVRGRPDERLTEVHARIRSAAPSARGRSRRRHVDSGRRAGPRHHIPHRPDGNDKNNGPLPPANSDTPTSSTTRKIVYSDDLEFPSMTATFPLLRVGTIHVGDREVEIDQTLHTVRAWPCLSPTPAWSTRRTTTACGSPTAATRVGSRSRHAWRPLSLARDRERRSVGRLVRLHARIAGRPGRLRHQCWPRGRPAPDSFMSATDDAVAVVRCRPTRSSASTCTSPPSSTSKGPIDHQFRLDVTSDQVIPASPRMYAQDVSSHPRALVVGDPGKPAPPRMGYGPSPSWARGWSRVAMNAESVLDRVFDTATGQPYGSTSPAATTPIPDHRRPATKNSPSSSGSTTTPWRSSRRGQHRGDLLTCHLSDGRCDLAVKAAPPDKPASWPAGTFPADNWQVRCGSATGGPTKVAVHTGTSARGLLGMEVHGPAPMARPDLGKRRLGDVSQPAIARSSRSQSGRSVHLFAAKP